MFCIKCGVELSDGQKICPICDTRVYHPDIDIPEGKDTYPKCEFKSEEFNRKGLMFAITIFMLIPMVLTLILELSWQKQINWSGYVFCGIIFFYVSLILPFWFKRPTPAIFVPSSFASAILLIFYSCLQSEGDWFFKFALPLSIALCVVVSTVSILLYYLKFGRLYIIGGGVIALGFWTVLLEHLIRVVFSAKTDFIWSLCPLVVLFIIGMFLIIVEIVKPFKESLRKIFFVG